MRPRLVLFALLAIGCDRPAHTALEPAFSCAPAGGPLRAEAGFVELPDAHSTRLAARYFYSFRPADTDAAARPLLLFFNGGPTVTSLFLRALHTGPRTIDPRLDGSLDVVGDNATSFTAFGNLLYVDARRAGFSYDVFVGDGPPVDPGSRDDASDDARAFLLILLRFFDDHPSLRCNPVVIVGESYGGQRATFMLDLLYDPGAETGDALAAALDAHFAAVLPGGGGRSDPAVVERQFGWQILIQPLVGGTAQLRAEQAAGGSPSPSPADEALRAGITALGESPERVADLLGVDLRSIEMLLPAARERAIHPGATSPEDAWAAALGPLRPGDRYFNVGGISLPFEPDGARFVEILRHVHTFITDAALDGTVHTPLIAPVLATLPPVAGAQVEGDGPSRRMVVTYRDGTERAIRLPRYERSSHMVSATEPSALRDDVLQFLSTRFED